MNRRVILLMTIVIGYLSTGIKGDGHLTMPSATNVSITRVGCGTTKLCLGDEGCDPAGDTLCTFVSAEVVNATNVDVAFELFGSSAGYIAVVLTTDLNQGGGVVFVCSRDPDNAARNFLFRTASQNGTDGSITLTNTPRVDSITYNFNGNLSGTFHQCSFTTRNLTSALTRASLGFQVSVVSGSVAARPDSFVDPPSARLFNTSGIVDIANPMALSPTTAMPTTVMIEENGHLTMPSATNVSITRDGCGTSKLCLGEEGCDPAGNTLCTFVSTQLVNATNVDVAFELFGSSAGYIALVLTTDLTQGGGVVFICSRDPNSATRNFLFRTASQNGTDGSLTLTTTPRVDSITYNFNGSLSGTFHQCTFTTRNLTSAFTRASLGVQVSVVSGSVNADGSFAAPSARLFNTSGIVDIANPMALSPTTAMPTTMAMTTSGCPSLMHPLTQGIAILVSILALRLL